jgi:hypothetical protein
MKKKIKICTNATEKAVVPENPKNNMSFII